MNRLILVALILSLASAANTQTLIATSSHPEATASHNQRKIVRDNSDNVYVVYEDISNNTNIIRIVMLDRFTEQWSLPATLTVGKSPTIAINKDGRKFVVFETNDSVPRICYISSDDLLNWSMPKLLSDSVQSNVQPVADVDSAGYLNIFWVGEIDSLNEELIYCCVYNDTSFETKTIASKNNISDVAIANHLNFARNELFFAYCFDEDSILFFMTKDNLQTSDTILSKTGSNPGLTFNSFYPGDDIGNMLRMIYIDSASNLIEFQSEYYDFTYMLSAQIPIGQIDNVCIDNVAIPIGYSFLFMKNGILYHAFSYGPYFPSATILDTVDTGPMNPSIAYKQFNFEYVDYIWMEQSTLDSSSYPIYHKRDEKAEPLSLEDHEPGKGFSIVGFPNPFKEIITINITTEEQTDKPLIQIYNTTAQLVKIPEVVSQSGTEFSYPWDATNMQGQKVKPGLYIILCTVNNKKTGRKVFYVR